MEHRDNPVSTRSSAPEMDCPDYRVSQEMVERFIQSGFKQERNSFSITPYPSVGSPVFFVVNFDDGWTIIPGDSRFGFVLTQSATGHVDLSVKSDNPGFRLWLEDYQNQINSVRGRSMEDSQARESARNWEMYRTPMVKDTLSVSGKQRYGEMMWAKINFQTNTVIDTIGYTAPLLQTKWGQGNPWNVSMPEMYGVKCLTGCAAVAVSQVLYFFHDRQNMPTGLYGSVIITGIIPLTESYIQYYSVMVNRSNFTYNSSLWDSMPLDSLANNPTGYKIVSDFMLDVGARLGLHYSPYDTHKEVDSFGYYDTTPCKVSGTWAPYSYPVLFSIESSLDSNRPVIIGAHRPYNNGGHTWVVDGYFITESTTTTTYEWWPVNMIPPGTVIYGYKSVNELLEEYNYMIYQGMLEITETESYSRMLHMNWGWNGRWDGYYTIGTPYYEGLGFTENVVVQVYLIPDEFTVN